METNLVPIIGLEVHLELATRTKMFCGCLADHFRVEPNTQVCPVCLGLPGALPVPNKQALLMSIKVGLALNCTINQDSFFERKNYFYPDLPKGYQISQYKRPLCVGGYVDIPIPNSQSSFRVRINRAHQEEDTAKLVHRPELTLIDFNRSGVPLLEIVTEPDIRSPEEAVAYLKELQLIIRSLGISGADMEKGTMRLEANISLGRPLGEGERRGSENLPDYRVELKNINSFRFIKKGLEYEIERQREALSRGEKLHQETRGYDEKKGVTFVQRSKEEAHDYRYFPEPDIPPLYFSQEEIEQIRNGLPELPAQKRQRYVSDLGLTPRQATLLTGNLAWDKYFAKVLEAEPDLDHQKVAKFIINNPKVIGSVSNPKESARRLKNEMVMKEVEDPNEVLFKDNLLFPSGASLEDICKAAIDDSASAVKDYLAGKESAINVFMGKVIRRLRLNNVKINPSLIRKTLGDILSKL